MRRAAIAVFLALASTLALLAQETRGSIVGKVLDPTGAVVAGAVVRAKNTNTNIASTVKTNETGYYEANLLLPGSYEVTVEAQGFKTYLRRGIDLSLGSRVEVNADLAMGSVAETVSVTAEAPLLDTTTASTGRVIDTRALQGMPIMNGMSLLLANLAPGVQTSGVNNWVQYHSGGGPLVYSADGAVGGNEFSIDGAPVTAGRISGFIPHSDSVEELKLETSSFEATQGHATGLQIAMMTKAGTNQFHGSFSDTYWTQRWGGANFFVRQKHYKDIAAAEAAGNKSLADQIRNTPIMASGFSHNYAATIGGPVVIPKVVNGRNKLFFFFSYNGFKDIRPEENNVLNYTVPGAAERQGDFSRFLAIDATRYQIYDPLSVKPDPARASHVVRTPFAGNIIPKSRNINPIYDAYTKLLPLPNNEPTSPRIEPTNNFLANGMKWDLSYYALANRIDYQMNEKHRFFGRWTKFYYDEVRLDWSSQVAPGATGQHQERWNRGATVDWVYSRSATTVIDVSASANERRGGAGAMNDILGIKPSSVGFPTYMDGRSVQLLPQVGFSGYSGLSRGHENSDRQRANAAKIDVTRIRGAHTIRAGFDVRNQFRSIYPGGALSGSFSFDNQFMRKDEDGFTPNASLGLSWAAFYLGMPSGLSMPVIDTYITSNPYFAWYGQDTWRVTNKLSVTYGLRVEYELGAQERFNRAITYFDPSAALPVTTNAQNAYARTPIAELAASSFSVKGGSLYAGSNGNTRRLWQGELMWLPRVGFAYQLRKSTVIRGGFGMFYDTNNVQNIGADQSGFSRTTASIMTTDFGQNWLLGNPGAGISALKDPFPIRTDGTRFDAPTRDTLGLMTKVGRGWSFLDYNLLHARKRRWRIGVQHTLGNNNLIEVAYAGSYSDHVPMARSLSPLPSQYWNTTTTRNDAVANNMNANVTNPFALANFADLRTSAPLIYADMTTNGFFTSGTIQKNKLLRAYPQMNGVSMSQTSIAEVKTHQLEVSYNRRFSKGFTIQGAFTRMSDRDRDFFYNEYEPSPTWRASNNGRPVRLTLVGVWELPFGRNRAFLKKGIGNWIFGGFQFSATYEYQPGPLLDWGNAFYYGKLEDITKGTRTFDRWFNTDNFERNASRTGAAYQARVFPTRIDGLRADCTNQINANLQRTFRITERVSFDFRFEALNAGNRSQMGAPDMSPTSTNFGRITSQSQAVNRFVQILGKIRF
jgi:hypothetical protein